MRAGLLLVCLLLVCLPLAASCGDDGKSREIWIYTSIYPSVLRRMEPVLAARFPDVRFQWYQKGSEQVAARLTMELEAGGTPCDLLMTSDPFYYAELKDAGRLLPYASPAAQDVPDDLRDPDDAFTTVRIPLMVLGVNASALGGAEPPRGFADLSDPAYRGLVSMGDPLKSGTTFTTVASLARSAGWPLLEGWGGNGLVAAGGNSAVLQRLESGERPIGVILLENLLPRIAEGAPLAVVYPDDGAVPIPSPVAILQGTDDPALAKQVVDAMFSAEIQATIVAGHMYSPLVGRAAPEGARAWNDLALAPWDDEFVSWVRGRRNEIKQRFREILRR